MRMPLAFGLGALLLAPASAQAAPGDPVIAAIGLQDSAAPGCIVGLFRDGAKQIRAIGVADVATGRPLDAETQFYSASVGKQFTALAAAQLIAAGKVRLDDDVRKWIPELPEYRAPIDVAMLLDHSSGIRDFLALAALSGRDPSTPLLKEEALAMVLRQRDTNHVPGQAFSYTNGGYLLLAEIVERASGMRFPDYVAARIFKPLGMKRSYVLDGRRPADGNVAHGYVPKDDAFVVRDTYPLFGGSGGIMFTMNDLARYDHDINVAHRVWTPAVTKIMMTPGRLSDGSPAIVPGSRAVYAAGQMLFDGWAEHGGGAEGFRHSLARHPSTRLTVATLCNRGDVNAAGKSQAVLAVLHPAMPPLDGHFVDPPSANGRYVSDELGTTYALATVRGRMRLTILRPDGSPAPDKPTDLHAAIDGAYLTEKGDMKILFDADGQGFLLDSPRASGIRFRRGG